MRSWGGDSDDIIMVAEESPGVSSNKLQVTEGGKPIKGEHQEKYETNLNGKILKMLRKKRRNG